MTNEAVKLSIPGGEKGRPLRFAISDTYGFEKGTVMVFSGATNIICPSTDVQTEIFAGIANTEKVAGDGSTNIGVWTEGVFDMKLTHLGGAAMGTLVKCSGANTIGALVQLADLTAGKAFGRLLETAADNAVVQVQVGMA